MVETNGYTSTFLKDGGSWQYSQLR